MKTFLVKGITVGIAILTLGTTYSQLKISGEIRPRFEYRHGYKTLATPNMDHAAFVDQRTRLNFDYSKNRTKLKVTLQDVRTWGNQSQLVGNENFGVSIHEAWGETTLKNKFFKLKFGRQELVYDDHRILGSVGWAQQARSHDVVLLKYGKDKLLVHFGLAYNQEKPHLNSTSYSVAKSYKTMQLLWGNYVASPELKISFLAMGVGQQVDSITSPGYTGYYDNYTLTTGTRIKYDKNKMGIDFSGYYQLGATNSRPAKSVSAYNLNIAFSYKLSDKYKMSLGYATLSGNDKTDTTVSYGKTQHAFNPYFGTNHKFNGYMDYFYVGNHGGNVGLNDVFLTLNTKQAKFSAGLTGHVFLANTNILDKKELTTNGNYKAMSPYLGAEIDIYGSFKLAPKTTCKIGYSQMFGTASMEAVKGGSLNELSNWGYIMLIMKPVLFSGK